MIYLEISNHNRSSYYRAPDVIAMVDTAANANYPTPGPDPMLCEPLDTPFSNLSGSVLRYPEPDDAKSETRASTLYEPPIDVMYYAIYLLLSGYL